MSTTSEQPTIDAADHPSPGLELSSSENGTSAQPALAQAGTQARNRGKAQSLSLWPLLARLHFYAGILIAPFLVVAAVTGLAYALTPQIEPLVHPELRVSSTDGPIQPIEAQVRAAREAHPEGTLIAVNLPREADHTTGVVLSVPELGEELQRTVYVDPYTAEVKGALTTWFDTTPFRTWMDDLHRNLQLGEIGRYYSELAASWLWIIALSGLTMWLLRGRTYRSGKNKVRDTVVPNLSARGVRRTRGWHATTGVWLIVGLLILSATGLTWSRYAGARFSSLLDTLDAHRPDLDTSLTGGPAGPAAAHHGGEAAAAEAPEVDPADIATVLNTARGAGLAGPIIIAPPAEAGTAWSATQNDEVWPVRMDAVAVDPETKQVTARTHWDDAPVLAKLSRYGILAHMGTLFGPLNQILLIALALGLLCVIFWGYRMWWQRRPTRADRSRPVGTLPTPGTWRRLPSVGLVLGVIVTAGLCWALPVFGWSLVAFLLVDLYVAEFSRQRDAATREAALLHAREATLAETREAAPPDTRARELVKTGSEQHS